MDFRPVIGPTFSSRMVAKRFCADRKLPFETYFDILNLEHSQRTKINTKVSRHTYQFYIRFFQSNIAFFVKLNLPKIRLNQNLNFRTASANPRPAGRIWPFKLFSAALLLPLKIDNLKENQQIQLNYPKIWPLMRIF